MRNMSFALTTQQIRNKTKTVTRRLGWTFVKTGDLIQAVEKCQGLKKGEKVKRLVVLKIVNVRRERLAQITAGDIRREGFGQMSFYDFCEMFCHSHKGCGLQTMVTRIEFEYI